MSFMSMCSLMTLQRKTGTLQLSLPDVTKRWTLLCIDLAAAALGANGCAYSCLRAVQLCSRMSVRGVFTSDIKFGIKARPVAELFALAGHIQLHAHACT